VWGGASQASHWAADGPWGNPKNKHIAMGFWDDAAATPVNTNNVPKKKNSTMYVNHGRLVSMEKC